ncbi:hypothetical protein [Bacteroides sp. 51]|uniref:hypothetical protein n=1 Tax=Bacteroides sp. 51 TaxID=2302938 RepID=UPI0013D72F14|nr:hypothetical protein [Bacteroides sp. 51]
MEENKPKQRYKDETDKNGNYQIFFELKDDELKPYDSADPVSRGFQLTFDLDNLPKDTYFMPTEVNRLNESQKLFFSYDNRSFEKGEIYERHLYVPQKQWIEVTVVNNQPLGGNSDFAIRNWITYGSGRWSDNDYSKGELACVDYPIKLTEEEVQTFRVPCAANDSNRIALACAEGATTGWYETISPIQKVYVTKDKPGSLQLENNLLAKEFRFKLKAWSDGRTVAPFENIVFLITDWDGKESISIPSSLCSYYDSIVWSADGYPDHLTIYRDLGIPHYTNISEWRCHFFQNKPLYTRLQGYRNGRVMFSDSVQTVIGPRDFLRYDWDDPTISIDAPHYVCSCPLYKEAAFHYYLPAEQNGHLYSKVTLVRNDYETDDAMFTERARKTLSGLMDYHLGEQKSFDLAMAGSLFHCLPTGVKAIAYWQTPSTHALLIEAEAEEGTYPSVYIHAEPR